MPKRSIPTIREQPVAEVTSVSGQLKIVAETLTVDTDERIQLIDLTDQLMPLVRKFGVKEGVVNLSSMHTTCTVFINEFQRALMTDVKRFLEHIVTDDDWLHDDPEHSDCDRANADSHLRALLLGHALTLQISGGEVVLGKWQRILMAELDGPRPRSLRLQVMGVE